MELLLKILYFAPPLLVAVIVHEVAHGWVAERLGDPTARRLGRITLNPIVHVDLWLTILLPALLILSGSPILFGGAKPVPINPLNFKNPRRGMAYVAIAGPLSNLMLLLILWPCFELLKSYGGVMPLPTFALTIIAFWVVHGILINIVLALFNLLPIPPLDGGRVAVGFLPVFLAKPIARLEPFGLIIVILLLASGTVGKILDPIIRYLASNVFQ